ncbi:HD domain-containing phosphohydrolase [Gilvimarinus sp. DA14]|uniref:HD domain-containing phosphohydrolase n=1 Tax=Gilvimarinus sp. DA14 TaxID=2956798 RepID=UPI0020B86AC3|nr:HD domain-containing phosphohydrolase [Gilvimarinus sp. DA14]UTF60642.1 transporter substrate-binding domain-containing protein [Gilvimarinus sp. DA14]
MNQTLAPKPFRISMRTLVVSTVALTLLLTAGLVILLQYYFTRNMAIEAAVDKYQLAALSTSQFIEEEEKRGIQLTRLLSRYPSLLEPDAQDLSMRDLFAEVMLSNNIFFSIYVGFANGDFYEVINLNNSPRVREQLQAEAEDRWVINRVYQEGGQRIRQLTFVDHDFRQRHQRTEPSSYDVRQRMWFTDATNQAQRSAPYIFQFTQDPGKTFSIKIPDSDAVLGIDVTLQSFSTYLRENPLGRESEVFVYDRQGTVIASNQLAQLREPQLAIEPVPLSDSEKAYIQSLGALQVSNETDWPPIDFAVAGEPKGYAVELIELMAASLELPIQFINGYTWPELLEKFETGEIDLLQPVQDTEENRQRGHITRALLHTPYSVASHVDTPAVNSMAQLYGKTVALPQGWSLYSLLAQQYPEIKLVGVDSTKEALTAVSEKRVHATIDADAILRHSTREHFIDSIQFGSILPESGTSIADSLHLIVAPRLEPLVPLINRARDHVSAAHIAELERRWFRDSENDRNLSIVPYKALLDTLQQPEKIGKMLPIRVNGEKHFMFVDKLMPQADNTDYFAAVVPAQEILQGSLNRIKISLLVTLLFLLLLLPVCWFSSIPVVRPIRQLFDKSEKVKLRQYDQVSYCPSRINELHELSNSMVDMAESIQQHEAQQRSLMDSFIQLIAEAIDEKSPYTGGHCARVPELGLMLADAAHRSNHPAFKDFRFNSEEEHREFKIAAWLHDCGKITMPEHIVDKGSKLETIYNRIHEVRMRFEVLWRDAELNYERASKCDPEKEPELKQALQRQQQQLQDDFRFIAQCNVGGEFMHDSDIERLKKIGSTPWLRYFDNRQGLSPVEEQRLGAIGSEVGQSLPAQETLLADKPEHIIPRVRTTEYPERFGINMKVPKNLYNLGEIHNLAVSRGTLSEEDRFKINEHIISTIRMLDRLPFPPELQRVPRYASTHHEAMNGKGYPRGLSEKDLTIPDKVLIVADIFEALTASDRPYKKAKPLSVSLTILHKMVEEGHVDRDTFELFLTSGVYMDYARRFLPESQIDQVNIQEFLTSR